MTEDTEEIVLDEEYQKELTKAIISIGQKNNVHPIKFVLATITAVQIICDYENLKLDDLLILLNDTESDKSLH